MEICDRKRIPALHIVPLKNAAGRRSMYDLEIEIENEKIESLNAWARRKAGRPYPNGTEFGMTPPPNPTQHGPPGQGSGQTGHGNGGQIFPGGVRNLGNQPTAGINNTNSADKGKNIVIAEEEIIDLIQDLADWERHVSQINTHSGTSTDLVTTMPKPDPVAPEAAVETRAITVPDFSHFPPLILPIVLVLPPPSPPSVVIEELIDSPPPHMAIPHLALDTDHPDPHTPVPTFSDEEEVSIAELAKRLTPTKKHNSAPVGIGKRTQIKKYWDEKLKQFPSIPKKKYTWGRRSPISIPMKKPCKTAGPGSTSGTSKIKNRLRSASKSRGLGSTPDKAIPLSDSEPEVQQTTPEVTETHVRPPPGPRRSLRMTVQDDCSG